MELVTVKDGSCTVYVEKNLIKQVVIHPQIQQVPGAPDHICGIMLCMKGLRLCSAGWETAAAVPVDSSWDSGTGL